VPHYLVPKCTSIFFFTRYGLDDGVCPAPSILIRSSDPGLSRLPPVLSLSASRFVERTTVHQRSPPRTSELPSFLDETSLVTLPIPLHLRLTAFYFSDPPGHCNYHYHFSNSTWTLAGSFSLLFCQYIPRSYPVLVVPASIDTDPAQPSAPDST